MGSIPSFMLVPTWRPTSTPFPILDNYNLFARITSDETTCTYRVQSVTGTARELTVESWDSHSVYPKSLFADSPKKG
jgi:hypothetical protein